MEEEIKLAIVTVDDSREEKKAAIRLAFSGLEEVVPVWYDCRTEYGRFYGQARFPNIRRTEWVPKQGEAGIWYSQASAWEYAVANQAHVLVIEDDALCAPNAQEEFIKLMDEVPEDYDSFSLFVPANQEGDYQWDWLVSMGQGEVPSTRHYDKYGVWADVGSDTVCRAWQGYSCVANVFSPKGAQRLLDAANEYGMYTPVDCFIFEAARAGIIDAYSQKPRMPRLVDVDWSAPSTIAHSERMS